MASQTLSFTPIAISAAKCRQLKLRDSSVSLPVTSFLGEQTLIRSSNLRSSVPKRHSSTAVMATVNVEETPKQKRDPDYRLPNGADVKWSLRAIKAFSLGEKEAKKLRYPDTGTEALLMGIMVEGTSSVAKYLREHGITHFRVREEALKLLGKGEVVYNAPPSPPLTVQARRALDWALDEKLKSGDDGEITTAYLLLGIWAQEDSAGHLVLSVLGFNDEKAKEIEKFKTQDYVMSYDKPMKMIEL